MTSSSGTKPRSQTDGEYNGLPGFGNAALHSKRQRHVRSGHSVVISNQIPYGGDRFSELFLLDRNRK